MTHYEIKDHRYFLALNGYSFGTIIALLERLDELVKAENGEQNRMLGYNFFHEGLPSTFDEKEGVYRYCIECYVKDIIEIFLRFDGGNEGLRSVGWSYEVTTIDDLGSKTSTMHFADFYQLYSDTFAGLTLKEWGNLLEKITAHIREKIRIFIPDFKFMLTLLHQTDAPGIRKETVNTMEEFKENNG